jgi:hypothetical protein
MEKSFISILIFIAIINTASYGQKLHRMGLLSEDISKNTRIKKAEPKEVLYKLPSFVDNSAHMPPVGNQGIQSCCVAWAFGYYYKTYQEWQDNGWSVTDPNHIFSPAFIYNHIDGGQDSGSYFSDAFLLLAENGCATIAEFPYNDSNYTAWPSESVYRDAIKYRSGDTLWYYQTTSTAGINGVKQLLANGNVAVLGIQVYENFEMLNSNNDTYCVRNTTGSSLGGHAITFVGYDDNKITLDGKGAFKMINQWGTSWGDSGYFWMSYQAVMNTYLSEGAAYFITDRGQYSPSLIASAQIMHPDINLLNLGLGIESTNSTVSLKFFNFTMNTLPHPARPFPSNSVDFDLTGILSYYNTGKFNEVFLSAQSTVAGIVNNFSFTDLRVSNTIASTQTPKTISGSNTIVYTNISLVPSTVTLSSPLDNSAGNTQPVKLKWVSFSGACNYRLQFSTDSTFTSTIIDTTGLTDTLFTVSSLSNLKKYYWRVYAIKPTGTYSWSTTWNFTTSIAIPSVPILLSPAANAVNQATTLKLSWNASSGASSYKVQVSTSISFNKFIVNDSTVTATSGLLTGLSYNTKYYWRVSAKNAAGISAWSNTMSFTTLMSAKKSLTEVTSVDFSGIVQEDRATAGLPDVPKEYNLYQNYPNPFNPTTTIDYSIPKSGFVTIKIYNVLGSEIKTLVNEEKSTGSYSLQFYGGNLASGIYFCRMQSGSFFKTKKLFLLK